MIHQASRYIVIHFCGNSEYDRDTLIYGCEALLSTILNCAVMLIMASIFGFFMQMVTIMLFYISLRLSAGGYHAPNYLICFIVGISVYTAGIVIGMLLADYLIGPYILTMGLLSVILIFRYAPCDCENRPFSSEEYIIFKRRSRIMIFVLLSLIVVLWFFHAIFAAIAMNGVLGESVTLIRKNQHKKSQGSNKIEI
ncbi:MAG: accessory gene regulator B family protein [Lachnoclostridium sp.]|jgi:accessory gene regulator B|nr:accessory gene regulator B family protein [Lachnoclostridium sp.]